MLEEIWKDIDGYEGFYQISNFGSVKSLDRYIIYSNGNKRINKGRIMKINKYPNGYCYINFQVRGERKTFLIHRLVAEAFIPNLDEKPEVNHLDEVITNNYVDNLEWVTSKENANYGTRNERCAKPQRIRVVQLDNNFNLIKVYDSITKAGEDMDVSMECIIRVCKGKQNTSKGFKWMYEKDYDKYVN